MMERIQGPIPQRMIQSSRYDSKLLHTNTNVFLFIWHFIFLRSRKQKYFNRGRLDWNEGSKVGRCVKAKCKPLRVSRGRFYICPHQLSTLTFSNNVLLLLLSQKHLLSRGVEHHQFFNLLETMLEYEPTKRTSLSSAGRHPFLLPLTEPGRSRVWRNSLDLSRWRRRDRIRGRE